VGRDLEAREIFCLSRAQSEMLFLVISHYKMRGRPVQVRAQPEPGPKTEARHVPWDVHGQDFLGQKTWVFSARSEPGPTRGMLRST
jgi:hypothetical protein